MKTFEYKYGMLVDAATGKSANGYRHLVDWAEYAALKAENERLAKDVEFYKRQFNDQVESREELESALSRTGAVKVKALEWEPVHGEGVETYQATCSIGIYRVFNDEDSAAGAVFAELAVDVSRFCMTDALSIGRVHDFDSAKAAAQADYERRVLSCITTEPAAPEGRQDENAGLEGARAIASERLASVADVRIPGGSVLSLTRLAEQAVTEAMVETVGEYLFAQGHVSITKQDVREALKVAMEAGR